MSVWADFLIADLASLGMISFADARDWICRNALLREGWIICFEGDGDYSAQPPSQQEWSA